MEPRSLPEQPVHLTAEPSLRPFYLSLLNIVITDMPHGICNFFFLFLWGGEGSGSYIAQAGLELVL